MTSSIKIADLHFTNTTDEIRNNIAKALNLQVSEIGETQFSQNNKQLLVRCRDGSEHTLLIDAAQD